MEKICWLLILVLLISCLSACQSPQQEQQYSDRLTESQKEEIERTFSKMHGGEQICWDEDQRGSGVRYYGEENGYVFLFLHNDLGENKRTYTQIIAGYTFVSDQRFILFGYKDGGLCLLKELYLQELISEQTIERLSKIHSNYEYQLVLLKELRPDMFE